METNHLSDPISLTFNRKDTQFRSGKIRYRKFDSQNFKPKSNSTTKETIPCSVYIWIDKDTHEAFFCREPENCKSEVNALGGYIPEIKGAPEEIFKLFLKLKKKPWLVQNYIKIN